MYLRKSQSDDPNESVAETLARHEKRLRDVAKQNGHHISHIYREVVSGETIAAREQIKRLLNEAREWDYVYCVREDRLARGDSVDQGLVIRAFIASDTKIVTPFKIFDLKNRSDQQSFEVSLFLARMEYRFINERMRDGLLDSLKEGQYLGRWTPMGYDKWTNEQGQKTLRPNDMAPVIQMMYRWSADENRSYYWIAKELTRMGIKPPRGGMDWQGSTIGEILRSEVYLGMIRWGRHKTHNTFSADGYEQAKEVKLSYDYDLYQGLHEPLIDKETFERSLQNAKARTPIHYGDELRSPLAGLMVCKKCGRAMAFLHDRRRDKYRYQHKNVSDRVCTRTKSSEAHVIMDAIKNHLMQTLDEMEVLVTDDGAAREAEDIETAVALLRKDLEKVTRAQEILLETLEAGAMPPAMFANRNAVHEERRAKIEESILELERSKPQKAAIEERIVKLSECLAVMDEWKTRAEEINGFLKGFIDRIEYVNDSAPGRNDQMRLDIYFLPCASSHTE